MRELDVDLDELSFAWQDPASQSSYYLDIDTGSVILVCPELDDLGELRSEIELQPDRYLFVPKPSVKQLELDLMDFVYALDDPKIKSIVEVALESPNKLKAAEAALSQSGLISRWQDWIKQSSRQRALRWLEAQGLRPTVK